SASETAQESKRLSRLTNSFILLSVISWSLSLRPPTRETTLQALGDPCQQNPGKRDDNHAHEERIGIEGLSTVGDHEADALAAAHHFADHHADQSQCDSLTDAGEDEGHRSRNRKGRKNLPVGGAVRLGCAQQIAIERAYTAHRVHQYREERGQEDYKHFRPGPDPEPDDDQRHHRHTRRCIKRVQEWI